MRSGQSGLVGVRDLCSDKSGVNGNKEGKGGCVQPGTWLCVAQKPEVPCDFI